MYTGNIIVHSYLIMTSIMAYLTSQRIISILMIASGLTYHVSYSTYIGCFKDGGTTSARAMKLFSGYADVMQHHMTINYCVSLCLVKGYTYAGLQATWECFCGSHGLYDQFGQAAEHECNRACSGDNTQVCGGGWRLSVYSTFSDLKSNKSYKEMDILNASLAVTRTISFNKTEADIDYAIVEHPYKSGTILVADKGLFELREDGSCHLLAGESPGQCTFELNRRSFSRATHLAVLNLAKFTNHPLLTTYGKGSFLLLADKGGGCVRVFNLQDTSTEYPAFGTCDESANMQNGFSTPLDDLQLNKPEWISVVYSVDDIKIIVTDKDSGNKNFQVIITITEFEAFAHSFHQESINRYIGHVDPIYGAVRSIYHASQNICKFKRIINDIDQSFNPDCNVSATGGWKTVPSLFMGSLLIQTEGYLKVILWQDRLQVLDVSGLDFEFSPIDVITVGEMSGWLLLKSSSSKEIFYVNDIAERVKGSSSTHKFTIFEENSVCGGFPYESHATSSIDNCAYQCAQFSMCRAFTISVGVQNQLHCSLYQAQVLGGPNEGSTCYFYSFI